MMTISTNISKYLRSLMLLIMLITASPAVMQASHIVGGDISYECLGNNLYRITMNVYRDCFFGDTLAYFDSPASIGIYDSLGILRKELKMFPMGDDTLTNNINDPCLFIPNTVCYHTTRYEKTVSLFPIDGGYDIIYQRCCRNETINNIENPLTTGATFFVHLSEFAMEECNSAPNFGGLAPWFICANNPFIYDHSAIEPDGDSLVYRLCPPLTGGTFGNPQPIPSGSTPIDTVDWIEPFYSVDNMLGGTIQPLAVDEQTGLLTAYPEIQGQFVVGVRVEEYRNGQLMSIVKRDLQFNVGDCAEYVSSFFAPSAQCDDLSVDFDNQSQVADTFLWYFNYPDTTWTSTEINPTFTYPDTGTYNICLIAEPNSVCADTSCQSIFLQDNSLFPGFELEVFDCVDSTVLTLTDLSYDTVSAPIFWEWTVSYDTVTLISNEQNPAFIVPSGISGDITLYVISENNCEQSLTQPFETGLNNPNLIIEDSLYICQGDSIELNPNFAQFGNVPYLWTPTDLIPDSTAPNPTVSPDSTTIYNVLITAPFDLCFVSIDITVFVDPLPELDFETDINCDGLTVNFNSTSTGVTDFYWDFGDTTSASDTSTLMNPTYVYPDTGNYIVTLATGPTEICQDTMTQEIYLPDRSIQADFSYDFVNCDDNVITIQFTDESFNALGNTVEWIWNFGDLGTSNEQNPMLVVTEPDTIDVTLTVISADSCSASTNPQTIEVVPIFTNIVDSLFLCFGDSIALNPGGDPSFEYLWESDPFDPDLDTLAANPIVSPEVPTTYSATVSYPGFPSCVLAREVFVFVSEEIGLAPIPDVSTCDPFATLTASTIGNVTITWTGPGVIDPNAPSITVPVSGTQIYTVTATDQYGCEEFDDEIIVEGGPVDIEVSADQIVCSDEPIDLSVTNLDPNDILTYQWTPADSLVPGTDTTANPEIIVSPGETTYVVDVENQFGCTATDSVFVAIVDANANLDFEATVLCNGATVMFENLSTNAYGYVWDFGVSGIDTDTSTLENPSYTYNDTGTYIVSLAIKYDVGCVDTAFATITIVNPLFFADFSYEFLECTADSIQIAFFDQSYNFQNNTIGWYWTFSNGDTSILQNPIITLYEDQTLEVGLTIETAINCLDSTFQTLEVDITDVNLSDTLIICYGDSTELNPNGNPAYDYVWSPGTGLSDSTSFNPIASPLETTTYSVEITNLSLDTCVLTQDVTVIVSDSIDLTITSDTVNCNQPVELTVSSNVPVDFIWVNSEGDSIGSGPSIIVNPDSTSTFCALATDQYGCTAEECVEVFVPEQIEVESESPVVSCQDTVTLSATSNVSPVTFQWYITGQPDTIGTGPQIMVNPVDWTNYTVVATDQYGCQASDTVQVIVPDTIFLSITNDTVNCNQPVELQVSSNVPVDFVWVNSEGDSIGSGPTIIVNPDSTSTFCAIGTDQYGCSAEACVTVIVPEQIEVDAGPVTISCQEPVTLTATSNLSPVTFEWYITGQSDTIGTGPQITVNPPDSTFYTVIATDTFGCQAADTAFVIVPDTILLEVTDDLISCNDTITLVATANLPVSYNWSNGTQVIGTDSILVVAPSTNITYYITVVDMFGCIAMDSVVITVPSMIELDVTQDTVACGGPVQLTASTNISPVTFEWYDQDTTLLSTDSTVVVDPDIKETYYVIATDSFGCFVADSVMVSNGIIEVEIEGEDAIFSCPVDSLTLTANNLDPNDTLDYVWTAGPGGVILSGGDSSTVTVSAPVGTTVFIVNAVNQLGCEGQDSVFVTISSFDPVIQDTVRACKNQPTELNPNGNPNYSYQWFPSTGLNNDTIANPIATVDMDMTYTVTISDFSGPDTCTAVLEVTVLVNPDIGLEAFGDTTLCEIGPVTISANADVPVNFEWFDDPSLSDPIGDTSSIVVTPIGQSIYYVIASDDLNCMDTAQVVIDAFPLNATTIPEYDLCIFDSTIIAVINNAPGQILTYQWEPDSLIDAGQGTATPTVSPLETTIFTVDIENQYGCTDTDTVLVNVIDVVTGLFAEADPDTILRYTGETSQLTTVDDPTYNYFWWPDESLDFNNIFDPIASPDTTTTYYITVEGLAGCRGIDSVTVTVLDPDCEWPFVFIPTAFSPNGDGVNDILKVRGEQIEDLYLIIYNRWGQEVFSTTDRSIGWDGTFKGEELEPDVFGYYMRAVCWNGDVYEEKGNITLVR